MYEEAGIETERDGRIESPIGQVSDRKLIQVAPRDITTIAEKVRPFLEKAVERSGGRLSVNYLFDSLGAGASQLWLGIADARIEMALVTYITKYPSGLISCQILVLAGERPDIWLECEPLIEKWARSRGCAKIEACARPGWERVARHYRKRYVMLEKELNDGRTFTTTTSDDD